MRLDLIQLDAEIAVDGHASVTRRTISHDGARPHLSKAAASELLASIGLHAHAILVANDVDARARNRKLK